MRFAAFVAVASTLFTTVSAFCGTEAGTPEQVAAVQDQIKTFLESQAHEGNTTLDKDAAFQVRTVWHIFYDQNNPSDGNIPDSFISNTIAVVNRYFSPIGLSFNIYNVERIASPYNIVHGADVNNAVEAQIKQRRFAPAPDGPRYLNIYITGQNAAGLAGWSSFPWEYQSRPQNDGIVYDYNYLAGGRNVGYNTGSILAHEIGHWVGLWHTFQGGCNGAGDEVSDTPAEASPASGCPNGRDSCTTLPGLDPIHNMMDYSDDSCRTGFTNGQFTRLRGTLNQYRGIVL